LLKGWDKDESKGKMFFLYPEGDDNCALCPVMAFLTLALEDSIFADVSTIKEILFPVVAPTQTHTLAMHVIKLKWAVLRAEVKTSNGWIVSEIDALPYGVYIKFLRVFSREEGFPGVPDRDSFHYLPTNYSACGQQLWASSLFPCLISPILSQVECIPVGVTANIAAFHPRHHVT
jgi:hypothetical protein